MIIYLDGHEVTLPNGKLGELLSDLRVPHDTLIALDTEDSGLHVDGDWHTNVSECSPPARVSAVSMAWYEDCSCGNTGWDRQATAEPNPCADCGGQAAYGPRLRSIAIPFDQGRVTGKPGLWSHETNSFSEIRPLCIAQVKKAKTKTREGGIQTCDKPHDDRCHTTAKSKHEYVPGKEPDYNASSIDWRALCKWLIGRPLDFHHAKYDCHQMRVGLRDGTPGINLIDQLDWDTQTVQGILEPTETNALKPTGRRLWGESSIEEKEAMDAALKLNGTGLTRRYDLVDWNIAGPYAAKDAELTIRLRMRHRDMWNNGQIEQSDKDIIMTEFALTKLLYHMEIRGIGFDADGMRHEDDHMRMEILASQGLLPFQPPNITQAKQWFFGTLGIIPIKTTDQGAPSLDAEVVARLVADGYEGAERWQTIAQMESARSKWYSRWPWLVGEDGRLRANFRQGKTESDRSDKKSGGAISGRLSADRVQTQGVPKEYKIPKGIKGVKTFVRAKPRHQVWELDLSNAEIRVFAWLSRCHALAARINSGMNIHDENTKAVFGIDESDPNWNMYRDLCKIGIFSDWYGSGERTMLAQFESGLKRKFDVKLVRDFKRRLNEAYPEVKRVSRQIQKKADRTMGGCGYVRLVNGRKRVFGWGEHTHKAANACVQGGVAEVMKVWMLEIDAKYPDILINQVHDSVWLEVPEDRADTIVADVQQHGAKIFERYFSREDNPIMFKVDAKRVA